MNRFLSLKSLAPAMLLLGTLAAAGTAQAHNEVQLSLGLGVPGVYVQPAPVYASPRPVYQQSAPVYTYAQPVYERRVPVYAVPQPVYVPPPVYGWGYPHHHHWERREYERGPWGDHDHDGTPNRYDRFPWNPDRR